MHAVLLITLDFRLQYVGYGHITHNTSKVSHITQWLLLQIHYITWKAGLGFALSVTKNSRTFLGLSRTAEAFFQDPVGSQQCLNIETLSSIPIKSFPHLQWIPKWFYFLDHSKNPWLIDWLWQTAVTNHIYRVFQKSGTEFAVQLVTNYLS